MQVAAGRLLQGRYRLGEQRGSGAMSRVFRAHDELLDRTVALKVLADAFAEDERFIARFYSEARTAAKIVDPHVVGVFDIIATGDEHAIVLEYMDGPSLADVLADRKTLDEVQAIGYARQIVAALAAAHAQGQLHRDIKPANLLLSADRTTLKVADFGLARALGSETSDRTMHGGLVGSVHYFSPEQAQDGELSAASDLYSVGVVIYQMCAGHPPFTGATPLAIAFAHVNQPPPSMADLRRVMSAPLAKIVARLLEKQPGARYQSALELEGDLAAIAPTEMRAAPPIDPSLEAPTIVGTQPFPTPRPQSRRVVISGKPPSRADSVRVARTKATRDAWRRRAVALIAAFIAFATLIARAIEPVTARLAHAFRARPGKAPARIDRRTAVMIAALAILAALIFFIPGKPATVAVPDLRAGDTKAARATLGRSGLSADIRGRESRRVPEGRILTQSPGPGAQLAPGSTVHLIASSGPPRIVVPSLVGKSYLEAIAILGPTKLRAVFVAKIMDAPASSVVEQHPAAGSRVLEGTIESVTISAGLHPRIRYTGGDGGD